MAYDEEQARRSRVVVETPTERREVVHSQSVARQQRRLRRHGRHTCCRSYRFDHDAGTVLDEQRAND